jgi:hypothetical protein
MDAPPARHWVSDAAGALLTLAVFWETHTYIHCGAWCCEPQNMSMRTFVAAPARVDDVCSMLPAASAYRHTSLSTEVRSASKYMAGTQRRSLW